MSSTLFTIEQANKMLPLIKSITANIMESWAAILVKRNEMEAIEKKMKVPQELKDELNYIIDKVNGYIKEVEDLGCLVEEFRRGIINFPSLFNGRKVFLNWSHQDASVQYYHELDETFKDRHIVRSGIFSNATK